MIRDDQLAGFLLACAYPDRIARRRHSGGFQLANGRSAAFVDTHTLGQQQWLAVAEVGGRRRAATRPSARPPRSTKPCSKPRSPTVRDVGGRLGP